MEPHQGDEMETKSTSEIVPRTIKLVQVPILVRQSVQLLFWVNKPLCWLQQTLGFTKSSGLGGSGNFCKYITNSKIVPDKFRAIAPAWFHNNGDTFDSLHNRFGLSNVELLTILLSHTHATMSNIINDIFGSDDIWDKRVFILYILGAFDKLPNQCNMAQFEYDAMLGYGDKSYADKCRAIREFICRITVSMSLNCKPVFENDILPIRVQTILYSAWCNDIGIEIDPYILRILGLGTEVTIESCHTFAIKINSYFRTVRATHQWINNLSETHIRSITLKGVGTNCVAPKSQINESNKGDEMETKSVDEEMVTGTTAITSDIPILIHQVVQILFWANKPVSWLRTILELRNIDNIPGRSQDFYKYIKKCKTVPVKLQTLYPEWFHYDNDACVTDDYQKTRNINMYGLRNVKLLTIILSHNHTNISSILDDLFGNDVWIKRVFILYILGAFDRLQCYDQILSVYNQLTSGGEFTNGSYVKQSHTIRTFVSNIISIIATGDHPVYIHDVLPMQTQQYLRFASRPSAKFPIDKYIFDILGITEVTKITLHVLATRINSYFGQVRTLIKLPVGNIITNRFGSAGSVTHVINQDMYKLRKGVVTQIIKDSELPPKSVTNLDARLTDLNVSQRIKETNVSESKKKPTQYQVDLHTPIDIHNILKTTPNANEFVKEYGRSKSPNHHIDIHMLVSKCIPQSSLKGIRSLLTNCIDLVTWMMYVTYVLSGVAKHPDMLYRYEIDIIPVDTPNSNDRLIHNIVVKLIELSNEIYAVPVLLNITPTILASLVYIPSNSNLQPDTIEVNINRAKSDIESLEIASILMESNTAPGSDVTQLSINKSTRYGSYLISPTILTRLYNDGFNANDSCGDISDTSILKFKESLCNQIKLDSIIKSIDETYTDLAG